MKLKQLKQNIGNLLYFTKNDLRTLEPDKNTLDANIKYWIKNNQIKKIKNGLYILSDQYRDTDNKDFYLEYLANQTISPSYLSGEYVLSKYSLLTEAVFAITSVTTKATREISNDLMSFRYYSISPNLFTGFATKNFQKALIFEASKEKAIFDFFYFRFFRKNPVTVEKINNLRINWENLSQKEFAKSKKYFDSSDNKNIQKAYQIIINQFL